MINICILGSSYLWTRTLVTDLLYAFSEPLEIRFIDINPEAAENCRLWGEAVSKSFGRDDKYLAFTDRKKALKGCDAVIITLSTGGLDAMEHDISIPEKYGIFATVGDTAGPGGWSRSIRNIPVFMDFAKDFDTICPNAFIANYTNPMSTLTATLSKLCRNPVAGFCHANFGIMDIIRDIFDLKDWSDISVEVAGMNHFTWVTDFKVGKKDGYKLLADKIGNGSIRKVCPEENVDEIGIFSGNNLFVQLYDTYKYITFPADRHISEFLPYVLTGFPATKTKKDADGFELQLINYCDIIRTPVSLRRIQAAKAKEDMLEAIKELQGENSIKLEKSRETGTDMIKAYLYNKPFTDVVNCMNIGQIKELPLGVCVETIGTVDRFGVRPLTVRKVPEVLAELMRPQALCTKWITDGVINNDKKMLLDALYLDPQCSQLKTYDINKMADELIEANSKFSY
jgi:alpha-galactosidase/6-phospho-beta-glucosidase family protein